MVKYTELFVAGHWSKIIAAIPATHKYKLQFSGKDRQTESLSSSTLSMLSLMQPLSSSTLMMLDLTESLSSSTLSMLNLTEPLSSSTLSMLNLTEPMLSSTLPLLTIKKMISPRRSPFQTNDFQCFLQLSTIKIKKHGESKFSGANSPQRFRVIKACRKNLCKTPDYVSINTIEDPVLRKKLQIN